MHEYKLKLTQEGGLFDMVSLSLFLSWSASFISSPPASLFRASVFGEPDRALEHSGRRGDSEHPGSCLIFLPRPSGGKTPCVHSTALPIAGRGRPASPGQSIRPNQQCNACCDLLLKGSCMPPNEICAAPLIIFFSHCRYNAAPFYSNHFLKMSNYSLGKNAHRKHSHSRQILMKATLFCVQFV